MDGLNSLFCCDSSFCPHCGSILPLPNSTKPIVCPLCSFKQDTSGELACTLSLSFIHYHYKIYDGWRHYIIFLTAYENKVEYTIKYFSLAKKRDKGVQESSGDGPLVSLIVDKLIYT